MKLKLRILATISCLLVSEAAYAACSTDGAASDLNCNTVQDAVEFEKPMANVALSAAKTYFEETFLANHALIEAAAQISGFYRVSEQWGHYYILSSQGSYGESSVSGEIRGTLSGTPAVVVGSINDRTEYDRGFNTDSFASRNLKHDHDAQGVGFGLFAKLTVLSSQVVDGAVRYLAAIDWTTTIGATSCKDAFCQSYDAANFADQGRDYITLRTTPVPGPEAGAGLITILMALGFVFRKRSYQG